MTYKELEAISKTWGKPRPPNGHAPMSSMTMPAAMYCSQPGSKEFEEAIASHDRMYFKAHPEEREKYGYTGP